MSARLAALLREVLDLPEPERAAFVRRACADEPEQMRRMLHLLDLDAAELPLLDRGLDEMVSGLLQGTESLEEESVDADHLQPDQRLGPWRLISRLGAGGMGSVWLAERADGQYKQQVALKTIKLGMDSALVLAQFRREQNALARLRHAHIASLLDGGLDEQGRPWFAMEYVQGISLREWLERDPSLHQRLRLFEKLCRAVSYAHQQLVIHRDVKPGNVIVLASGEPKLLDFGIAKLLSDESDGQTSTLHQFASRAYAAPEQLRGGLVSTATDIYALGALLFEMLTGQRFAGVQRSTTGSFRPSQVVGSDKSPGRLSRQLLRGDLDAIVMRALADEPERRYPSALSLAEDVHNFLSGHPVQARPDSAWYRLRKLVRRNRVASAALAAAILALATGLIVSMHQTARAEQQARRATAVTEYLTSLFDAGRSNAKGTAVRERTVADMLEDSAGRLRGELERQPEIRDELYTILVEIFDSNDQPDRSLALAQERVDSAVEAWGANDARVAPALVMLAGVSMNHGRLESVPELLQRAQDLLDRVGDRDSLSRAQLLRWQGYYGYVTSEERAPYVGSPLVEAAEILRRSYPDSDELLATLYQVAMLAVDDQKYVEAQAAIGEMRERSGRRYGGYNMYTSIADFAEGVMHLKSGHPDKAWEIASRGVDTVRRFNGAHHHDVLQFQNLRITALLRMERMDEARALWAEADAQRQRDWPDDERLQVVYAGLAEQLQ